MPRDTTEMSVTVIVAEGGLWNPRPQMHELYTKAALSTFFLHWQSGIYVVQGYDMFVVQIK